MLRNVTVFGGASKNLSQDLKEISFKLGEFLGENGFKLIFGIGDNGAMGEVYKGTISKKGEVKGITTQQLLELQCKDETQFDNLKTNQKVIVKNLYERKKMMFEDGDFFVVLAGGFGTIDEFSELCVNFQLENIVKKPLIFLNTNGYWNGQKMQIDTMLQNGAISEKQIQHIAFVNNIEDIYSKALEIYNTINQNSN